MHWLINQPQILDITVYAIHVGYLFEHGLQQQSSSFVNVNSVLTELIHYFNELYIDFLLDQHMMFSLIIHYSY